MLIGLRSVDNEESKISAPELDQEYCEVMLHCF